eukprot:TRINITY_DN1153_c0_g2_i2.p1 TRINITY_DN1153_c0_g2~~TRINITY_DN1153_c0_g2_i2.p1  ORF type:complete len:262 (+),score=60.70 TRINITY_DN1153_c0_g2_i2:79-864(+)
MQDKQNYYITSYSSESDDESPEQSARYESYNKQLSPEGEIINIPIDPTDAFDSFTHRLENKRKEKFYSSVHSKRNDQETPVERLRRLKAEVDELSRDVQGMDEGKDMSVGDVLDEVRVLKDQLERVQMNVDGDAHFFREKELSLFIKDRLSKKTGDESSEIHYSLYYQPSDSENKELRRVSEFEKRIQTLETVLGVKDNGSLPVQGLLEKLNFLEGQVSNMDPERISHVTQKMKLVSNDIDELISKHDEISPIKSSYQEKV